MPLPQGGQLQPPSISHSAIVSKLKKSSKLCLTNLTKESMIASNCKSPWKHACIAYPTQKLSLKKDHVCQSV
jgi:hypothetical protein